MSQHKNKKHTAEVQETKESHRRSSGYRLVLKVFIWGLIIAFVSTIGVTWDEQGFSGPIVISTKGGKIDFNPRGLYMSEYDRVGQELRSRNQNIDPRYLDTFIAETAFTNTIGLAVREQFYKDIELTPSPQVRESYLLQGAGEAVVDLQYGEASFFQPLGVASAIASPVVSDLYAFNDLRNFQISSEVLVLNKTNFLVSKLSDTQKSEYYNKNFDRWLSSIVVADFTVSSRKEARQLINLLKTKTEATMHTVVEDEALKGKVKYDPVKTVSINNGGYNFFSNVLNSFKNKGTNALAISAPIYLNGDYHVTVSTTIPSYAELPNFVQQEMWNDLVITDFDKMNKQHSSEWTQAIADLKTKLVSDESYTTIATSVAGAVNETLLPFTMVQETFTNVIGQEILMPLLTSKSVLASILNTELTKSSDLVDATGKKDLYIAVRPHARDVQNNAKNTENLAQDATLYQFVNNYKLYYVQKSLSDERNKKRYDLKTYPNALTNLIN